MNWDKYLSFLNEIMQLRRWLTSLNETIDKFLLTGGVSESGIEELDHQISFAKDDFNQLLEVFDPLEDLFSAEFEKIDSFFKSTYYKLSAQRITIPNTVLNHQNRISETNRGSSKQLTFTFPERRTLRIKRAERLFDAGNFLDAKEIYDHIIKKALKNSTSKSIDSIRVAFACPSAHPKKPPKIYSHYNDSFAEEYVLLTSKVYEAPLSPKIEYYQDKFTKRKYQLSKYSLESAIHWNCDHQGKTLFELLDNNLEFIKKAILNLNHFIAPDILFMLPQFQKEVSGLNFLAAHNAKLKLLVEQDLEDRSNYKEKYTDEDLFRDAFDEDIDAYLQWLD